MTRAEITNFWGRDNLARWSEASLREVAIPDSSKSFLIEVGMPLRADWTLRFDVQANQVARGPNGTHCVGFDDVVPICIDDRGQVMAVEEKVGGGVSYINSSIERFGECLVLYQRYRISVLAASEHEAQNLVSTTENQLRNADPTAFADPNSWWPAIVEQMGHGLL
jgi:hypothetical protein